MTPVLEVAGLQQYHFNFAVIYMLLFAKCGYTIVKNRPETTYTKKQAAPHAAKAWDEHKVFFNSGVHIHYQGCIL